jgi:hypothetical protein
MTEISMVREDKRKSCLFDHCLHSIEPMIVLNVCNSTKKFRLDTCGDEQGLHDGNVQEMRKRWPLGKRVAAGRSEKCLL